jgi:DinB superfamily
MRRVLTALAVSVLPCVAAAQTPAPVADAFKKNAEDVGKNLIAAAEEMPADKYSFRPTPPQMSFAMVVVHLANGNDYLCGKIAGATAPTRAKIDTTASKEALVARLKETFQFCDQSLASVDDSKLGEQIPFFGGKPWARASIMTLTTADWADHYSQAAIYLRLNGKLPPTAKKGSM